MNPGAFSPSLCRMLERNLPRALPRFRWFGDKSRKITGVRILETIALPHAWLVLARVTLAPGRNTADYLVPVAIVRARAAIALSRCNNKNLLAFKKGRTRGSHIALKEASRDKRFLNDMFLIITGASPFKDKKCSLIPQATRSFAKELRRIKSIPGPAPVRAEQSNSSCKFGNRYILKIYRRLGEGPGREIETGRYLTDRAHFKNAPGLAAALTLKTSKGAKYPLACMHELVRVKSDAWYVFTDMLRRDLPQKLQMSVFDFPLPPKQLVVEASRPLPPHVEKNLGNFVKMATLLGRRTMELHLALAKDQSALKKPFIAAEARKTSAFALKTVKRLRASFSTLPDGMQEPAREILKSYPAAIKTLSRTSIISKEGMDPGLSSRTHGDLHLGQVLWTGSDFMFIDFEGEPLGDAHSRTSLHPPLRDTAGMLRSFHYAANFVAINLPAEKSRRLEPWLEYWHAWMCIAFLRGYFSLRNKAVFLPKTNAASRLLLDMYLIQKAFYELSYELDNRPDWLRVPLAGLAWLLDNET